MTTDDLRGVPPLRPADATTPQSAQADMPPESAEFRRLLDRLEQLGHGAGAAPAPPADVDGFARALAQAEDDYVAAMDLRRRLEDAFRRTQP